MWAFRFICFFFRHDIRFRNYTRARTSRQTWWERTHLDANEFDVGHHSRESCCSHTSYPISIPIGCRGPVLQYTVSKRNMVSHTGSTGYRGRGSRSSARKPPAAVLVALSLQLVLLLLPSGHLAVKRKHHWKADVIKNHLKNHKSLEGMVRLVDGESENEGMVKSQHGTKYV